MRNGLGFVFSGVILLAALAITACAAEDTHPGKTDQIRIHYVPPENPSHQPIYELLKGRQTLEHLKEFLSPFRLEWVLHLSLAGCDGEADAMYSADKITICYEYIESLQKYMPAETTPAGVEPVDVLVGPFMDTVLHEFAHALFDYADIPVLGREEDAADQVSAYIYLQVGRSEARRLIMGALYAYLMEVQDAAPRTMADFAGEHSTLEQRVFNLLCMAYGADSELFEDVVARVEMPRERAEICEEEYELVALAFDALISPHIDPVLAEKVFDKSWLPEPSSRLLSRRR